MSDRLRQLTEELERGDITARRNAAEQLARLGADARGAAIALVAAAGDADDEVREWAVAALEDLGAPAAEQVDGLAGLLSPTEGDTAYWAATLLGRGADQAASAAGALIEALQNHPTLAVRERAAWAIGKIGVRSTEIDDALLRASQSNAPRLARLARTALDERQSSP